MRSSKGENVSGCPARPHIEMMVSIFVSLFEFFQVDNITAIEINRIAVSMMKDRRTGRLRGPPLTYCIEAPNLELMVKSLYRTDQCGDQC